VQNRIVVTIAAVRTAIRKAKQPEDTMNELALFAGAGGGILGGKLIGWRTVCAVEFEDYPRRVLLQRQRDGLLPLFPIWDDVRTFDGKPWRGKVDVVSGGFPCQDISSAGKGAGIEGERSGLWGEMARIIGEVRPRFAWVENSPLLVGRGLTRVLGDLAEMGYDARWGIVSAENAGALHQRKRIWIMAYAKSIGHRKRGEARDFSEENGGQDRELRPEFTVTSEHAKDMANAKKLQRNGSDNKPRRKIPEFRNRGGEDWCDWQTEPNVGRVANGVASRVDRLKAIGNGQCPQSMALAWRILSGEG